MSEAQKYQGALYKEKPTKNQRRNQNQNQNQNQKNNANGKHRAPYVEDGPDSDSSKGNAPPPAPSPPPTSTEKPSVTTAGESKSVNVFDYLVTADTPNASKVSLGGPKEQMKMVDHAPSVFEPTNASAHVETDNDDEKKDYDVAYEENGFSYGAGPILPTVYPGKAPNVSMEFMTPAPKKKKDRTRGENDKASATTSDKKRKRRTDDHDMDIDSPMAEAPSSVVNNPGTPMLKHSGLTGGLNRMMRSPSTEDGNESKEDSRRRYQDPSSPIKRTRRDHKDGDNDSGLGISMKQKAGRLVSSMFGGSAVSGSSNNSQEPEARRSKKSHRVASPSQDQMPSDSRKTKRKVSAQAGGDRPSQRLKQIEYNGSQQGDDGREVVVYRQENIPNELQRQMAAHFLSLVTKGPESSRGFSVNKVLKRFHREFTDEFDDDRGRDQGRSRADRERRIEDEKDLWRTLRVKQNERGEVVLFF
jgi:cell growth-regulating nucleolar protein